METITTDPLADPSVAARFWAKVSRRGGRACWEWQGARNDVGYGYFRVGSSVIRAHTLAYVDANGPVPPDRELHHRCNNRGCVNPDHLQPVTKEQHGRLREVKPQHRASIQRREMASGTRWRVMFRVGSKQISRTFATETEAMQLSAEIREMGALKALQHLTAERMT